VRRRTSLKETQWEEVGLDEHTDVPDVWEEAWRSVQNAQVRAALMHIPTEQRMVIELAYFQGWTHTEIADGCQLPLGTVKARMRLSLLHLKRSLEQMGVHEV
jgi:RNA polymerase sigma factor (sigma-70 family)